VEKLNSPEESEKELCLALTPIQVPPRVSFTKQRHA